MVGMENSGYCLVLFVFDVYASLQLTVFFVPLFPFAHLVSAVKLFLFFVSTTRGEP